MTETTTSRPVETIQRIYEAFFRSDLDGVMEHCWPDATISQDPALPWGGRFVGREGVADFAGRLMAALDTTVTPEAVYQAGDRVVQFGRSRGTVRANGRPYDVPECHVWTLRDGRVAKVEFFVESEVMLAALGS